MKKVVPTDAILIPSDATVVFRGVIFDVYQWQQTMFDGTVETFEMLKRPDTVQTLVTNGSQVLVIEDDQPGRRTRCTLPGGRVDEADESWQAAAQRELSEETGIQCETWNLIDVRQPQMKIEWFVILFFATGVSTAILSQVDTGGERIVSQWQEYSDLRSKIMADEMPALQHLKSVVERAAMVGDLWKVEQFQGRVVER